MNKFRLHLSQLIIVLTTLVLLSVSYLIGRLDIEKQNGVKRLAVLKELTTIGNRLEGVVRSTFNLTQGMVHLIRYQGDISKEQFEALCALAMNENPNIRNVAIAPSNVVKLVYPLTGNEKAVGLDYMKNDQQRESVLRAMQEKRPLLAGPVNLVQGGVGLINRSPIYSMCKDRTEKYWGIASIVAHYDKILEEAGIAQNHDLRIAIQGDDGKGELGKVFYGDSTLLSENPVIVEVIIPSGKWRLIAIPSTGWINESAFHSQYFLLSIIITALIVLFLSTLIFKNHNIRQNNSLLAQEIQERRRIEIELKKSKEAAEEANRVKTAFLANMSHEIRTPMNAIQGFSEVILKGNLSEKSTFDFIEIINNSSKQLLNVINDIIDISMIEAGQLKIIYDTVKLNRLLENIYSLHSNNAKSKGLRFNVSYGLPNTVDSINTDEHRLTQIINNLISNAVKFTNEGFVEFGYRLKNTHLEFYVKDTGIGIPKEFHDLVFERFRQVDDKLSRGYGGTGLGLSICKSIIEMMGGEIWIESEPNKGSTFFFTLPYEKMHTTDENEIVESNHIDLKDKTILIAEDDYYNYLLLQKLLESTNANLLRANNGQEAIDIFAQNSVDVVLMDIKMPVMNGYEAVKVIRENNTKIPIVAQTAYAMTEERQLAIEAGCDYYITKPIKSVELYEIFKEILSKR